MNSISTSTQSGVGLSLLAGKNFAERFKNNPYPGRVIIVGLEDTGKYMVQIYAIMGRSPNSRNRVFSSDQDGRLFTEAADPKEMKDPSLVIYNAMREVDKKHFVVSNGDQTDTVAEAITLGQSFDFSLRQREHEPDAPNFTQRITAVSHLSEGLPFVEFSIIRKSFWNETSDRIHHRFSEISIGFGFGITTYESDGSPLPPFRGDPILLPVRGPGEAIAKAYWEALNEENRVSLAVKMISMMDGSSKIHIINKYKKDS